MQEKEREEDILEVPQEKRTNKTLIIFVIIGLIAILLIALLVLSVIYLTGNNNLPLVNSSNNDSVINHSDDNLPVPNNTQTNVNGTSRNTSTTTRSSGGGGGGEGDEGDGGDEGCAPNKDCSYYYNLNQCGSSLSDGCNNILNCSICNSGFYCNATLRCVALPSCTSDANCTSSNGACKTGLCNLTVNSCYTNFSGERSNCSLGMCHLGSCVKCISKGDCRVNESCIDGTCFNENEAFSFMFMGDDYDFATSTVRFAYTNHPDTEILFWIPDNGRGPSVNFNQVKNEWAKNPNANPLFTPLFMGLGNHDAEVMMAVNDSVEEFGPNLTKFLPGMKNFREGPYDVYPNGYEDRNLTYSFDYKNAHFIMMYPYYHDLLLNISYIGGICGAGTTANRFESGYGPTGCVSNDMMTWLENDLKNTNATFKFMFYHEGAQPAPGGRHTGDSLDCIFCPGNWVDRSWMNKTRPPMTEKFWSLLAKYNVTANFVGHAHHNTLTWANDLYGGNGAVYEVESGNPPRLAVVNIRGENATLRLYNSYYDGIRYNQYEPFGDIILNKDSANHAPKLYQHNGGNEAGFPVVERRNIDLEVGQTSIGTDLWFEAKDEDREDNLTFSFNNLPSFLAVNDPAISYSYGAEWIKQYRRILLTTNTSSSNKLTVEHIGNYSFDIIVSDGQFSDSININMSILPEGNPVILGASILNGSTINFPMYRAHIYFFCGDNEGGPSYGRLYDRTEVLYNGNPMPMSGNWHGYASYTPTDNLVYERFELVDDYDGIEDVLPGRYDVTVYCVDVVGHYSNNFTVTFFIVNDSIIPTNQIYGSWPTNGASVTELNRISFWATSNIPRNFIELKKDGSLFSDYSMVSAQYNGSLAWGTFDILFNTPVANGFYEIKVNGTLFNVTVNNIGYLGSSAISSSLGIWSWFKGFLTGNAIKEIQRIKNSLSV